MQAISSVPITVIASASRTHWPNDLFVIPNVAFAVDCTGIELTISSEHDEVRWTSYREAERLLRWDGNKVALWELNERLIRGTLV